MNMKKTLFILLLTSFNFVFSQSVITGKVTDGEFNDFLPFANIVLQNNDGVFIGGTSTDFEGSYKFEVTPGNYIIEFSFLGYNTKRVTGIVVNQNEEYLLSITLEPASNNLEEVIKLKNSG